jgi:hypothetical protein
MANSDSRNIKASDAYVYYGFNVNDVINEGMAVVNEKGLDLVTTESRIIRNTDMPSGKNYNWIGYKRDSGESFDKQFDLNSGLGKYLDQDLLTNAIEKTKEVESKIDLGKDSKPARIKFTDRPLGVFSFAQASKGLIRVVEFYSPIDDKIINADLVQKSIMGEETSYYYLKEGEKIVLERRQEGTTKILKSCPSLMPKEEPNSKMILPYNSSGEIVNECNGNKLKYSSTNKKVYAYRDKKGGGAAPYVDLYIPTGGLADLNPEQMLLRGIPTLMLAKTLEKSGVKVRIFTYWSNYDMEYSNHMVINTMVKNYGEPIDINKLAVYTSDTRFYRYYLFNSYLGIRYLTSGKRGSSFTTATTRPTQFSSQFLPMLRNYVSYKIKEGTFPAQIVDPRLMISVPMDVSDGEKINDPTTDNKIMESYYSALDYIQINISKTPKSVIKEIYDRKKKDGQGVVQIKQYLRGLISDVYTPTTELQSDSPEKLKEQLNRGSITQKEYEDLFRKNIMLNTQEQSNEIFESRGSILEYIVKL